MKNETWGITYWVNNIFRAITCCNIDRNDSKKQVEPLREYAARADNWFTFESAAYSFRHPLKLHNSKNCDAYLIRSDILGIADGVNTVADENVDPLKMPKEILYASLVNLNKRKSNTFLYESETAQIFNRANLNFFPDDFLRNMLCRTTLELKEMGSTTITIVTAEKDRLYTATVGDSGLLLFRHCNKNSDYIGYDVVGTSNFTCHGFNNPCQITRMLDPRLPEPFNLLTDTYHLSASNCFKLKDGDIIIVGTDGFLENLYVEEIANILNKICLPTICLKAMSKVPLINPDIVAKYLVEYAAARAAPAVPSFPTPFAEACYRHTGKRILGGKPDDTTVIVAYVKATGETCETYVTPNWNMSQKISDLSITADSHTTSEAELVHSFELLRDRNNSRTSHNVSYEYKKKNNNNN